MRENSACSKIEDGLNMFDKTVYKLPALVSFAIAGYLALTVPLAIAADDANSRSTLRDVKTMSVVVEKIDPSEVQKARLSSDFLRSDLERRLSEAGIQVDPNAIPCIYVRVRPLPILKGRATPIGVYAIDFSVEFFQTVSLTRNPSVRTFAPTWSLVRMSTAAADDVSGAVAEILGDLEEKFISAYRSVNPK